MGATHANGPFPLAIHYSGNLQMPSAGVSPVEAAQMTQETTRTTTEDPQATLTEEPVLRTLTMTAPLSVDVTHVPGLGHQMTPCSGSQPTPSADATQMKEAVAVIGLSQTTSGVELA